MGECLFGTCTSFCSLLSFTDSGIIPALIYALDTLKKDGIEPFEELRWLKSIRRSLKQYECELSADILDTIPSYELAQKLIDCPIDKALSAIVSYDTTEEEM